MAIIEKLIFYLQYPFVVYAIITSVLIALCASLLGVTLVLKRLSYIGDGLSHVAFGAMAIASVVKVVNDMPLVLFITTLSAILLLNSAQHAKIKGDAAIAMLSVGSLAVGYLLVNVFSTSVNLSGDVCSTLFGSTSILTLTQNDVILCFVLSAIVIVLYVVFYHKIFAITFDESFSKAIGINVTIYNLMIAVITAIIIVLAMNLVGSLLITALVIFPAVSAMRVCKSFLSVTICSAIISVFCAIAGLLVSILAGTPVGSTIVVADIIVFGIFTLIGKLKS
ncbi:MAG: metal ABC transporter permease [Lachnospiraceae bacterium]